MVRGKPKVFRVLHAFAELGMARGFLCRVRVLRAEESSPTQSFELRDGQIVADMSSDRNRPLIVTAREARTLRKSSFENPSVKK